jgi:hypothetical protein
VLSIGIEIGVVQMKAMYSITLLAVLLVAACMPTTSPTPQATEALQLLTPISPEGTFFFEGCTYMVNYPPELMTTDGILFQSPEEEAASVFIIARRRTDDEQGLSLKALAPRISAQYASQPSTPSFKPVTAIDYLGNTLDGLQADLVGDEGQHIRLMVVVRPETLLGDLLPDDVIYELVAQSPEATWPEWAPLFEVMFQTFHPQDCGGV